MITPVKENLKRIYKAFEHVRFVSDIDELLLQNMELLSMERFKEFVIFILKFKRRKERKELSSHENFVATLVLKAYENVQIDIHYLLETIERHEYAKKTKKVPIPA